MQSMVSSFGGCTDWLLVVFVGNLGWPVIGRTLDFIADPDFLDKEYEKHGPISKINLLGENSVVLCGIENIKKVRMSARAAFIDQWYNRV